MPRELFGEVVNPTTKVGSRSWYTVPVSILAHIILFGAVIIIPLMATDVLPTPPTMMAFVGTPPPPPPPPPPAPAAAQPKVAPQPVSNPDAAPVEAPKEIVPEAPPEATRRSLRKTAGPATTAAAGMATRTRMVSRYSPGSRTPPLRATQMPASFDVRTGPRPRAS